MLLGDGSPTRHLRLLTGQPVAVDLIGMTPEPRDHPGAPAEVAELHPPLLRRQVWLHCDGLPLAWAESWWNQTEADLHLRDRNQPIWRSLTEGRSELFREVDGLALVNADWLELLQEPSPTSASMISSCGSWPKPCRKEALRWLCWCGMARLIA